MRRCGLMEVIAGKVHLHGFRRRTTGHFREAGIEREEVIEIFSAAITSGSVRPSVRLERFPIARLRGRRRMETTDGEPLRFGTCAAVDRQSNR